MVEISADKTNLGALVQKYEAGIKGFFKDDDAVVQFKKLRSVQDKLAFIWMSSSMQTFLKQSSEVDGGKSEGDTRRFRDFGNGHFKAGRDLEAVRMFGEAARVAPVSEKGQGRDLSLAIANRSAALVRLGRSRLALMDIQLALDCGYPKDMRYKLYERKVKIAVQLKLRELYHEALAELREALPVAALEEGKKEQMERTAEALIAELEKEGTVIEEQQPEELKVELETPSSYLPAFSSSVDIEFDPNRGRFARANKQIPAGTLLTVEKPQSVVLRKEFQSMYCGLCLTKTELCLVPCLGCSQTVYCSTQCREDAWGYHKYECGTQGLLKALAGSENTRDMGRLCYRAVCQYPGVWYTDNKDSLMERIPMYGDESWNGTPQHALLSLDCHHEDIQPGTLWSFLLCSLCHVRALQIRGYFGEERSRSKVPSSLTVEEVEVGGIVVQFLELSQYNIQEVTQGSEQDKSIGNGLYCATSLINHSCDCNVTKYYNKDRLVLVASRDILEGEEITDCYLPENVRNMEVDKRRAWLHHFYRFYCECAACVPESAPKNVPENVPENSSESVSESISENVLKSTSENVPESVPENVTESIIETDVKTQ